MLHGSPACLCMKAPMLPASAPALPETGAAASHISSTITLCHDALACCYSHP